MKMMLEPKSTVPNEVEPEKRPCASSEKGVQSARAHRGGNAAGGTGPGEVMGEGGYLPMRLAAPQYVQEDVDLLTPAGGVVI